MTLFLGDFGLSDVRQIALRLKITATASGSAVEMLDAHLKWEDAVRWTGTQERWAYLQAESTRDQAQIDEAHDKGLEEKVGRLQAAWEMEQAIRQFEAGQRHAAQERMRRAAKEYRAKREDAEAAHHEFSDDVIDGERASSNGGPASGGPGSMDVYLEEAAEEMEALEPDSDKARVLIKKSKRKSRTASGR